MCLIHLLQVEVIDYSQNITIHQHSLQTLCGRMSETDGKGSGHQNWSVSAELSYVATESTSLRAFSSSR